MSGIMHGMDGILPVYKPVGMTSYDVIREFKRMTATPSHKASAGKVGHGGTLDPFADGVLLLLLGKATKQMNELMKLTKTYRATAVPGAKSDTLDVTGTIVNLPKNQQTKVLKENIEREAKKFVGTAQQKIPEYSAAKVNGVPRYRLARQGAELTQKSKEVTIYSITIEELKDNRLTFTTEVSGGTYIRQLGYDLLKSLGVESYLESLTRTKIGDFDLDKCVKIEDFGNDKWKKSVIMY